MRARTPRRSLPRSNHDKVVRFGGVLVHRPLCPLNDDPARVDAPHASALRQRAHEAHAVVCGAPPVVGDDEQAEARQRTERLQEAPLLEDADRDEPQVQGLKPRNVLRPRQEVREPRGHPSARGPVDADLLPAAPRPQRAPVEAAGLVLELAAPHRQLATRGISRWQGGGPQVAQVRALQPGQRRQAGWQSRDPDLQRQRVYHWRQGRRCGRRGPRRCGPRRRGRP
mmetsp:Transcript_95058/g.264122  ORF Transcript_95058/g.264122 Transcript_95058/m.264122 type:complete len:226 (-) Transcript_95058:37-714(-)